MAEAIDRLKVLLDSSTPIVVMETVEEVRAVRLVRLACQGLGLSSFEWTIASGLVRSGMASGGSQGDAGIEHGLAPQLFSKLAGWVSFEEERCRVQSALRARKLAWLEI